ncbi:MAG: DUF924 domain-containing protein [Parachlamydiaceae bacterium]|nr:DUF924 domain-containing protein [Parachlamydiaceae bacterium]
MKVYKLVLAVIFCLSGFTYCHAEQQNDARIDNILNYWFGDLQTAEDYPYDKAKIWFSGGADVDTEIRERFENLLLEVANHKLDNWKKSPKGRLALIILVDQFSRNIYRGTPEAFTFDSIGCELTLEGIDLGADLHLLPIERAFFYLPLEHSENLEIQKISIAKFDALAASAPISLKSTFDSYANYAWNHYIIIEKFGRFPHRNVILGRESIQEEVDFLKGPNSSF